ncbi:hypothetical protein [Shewanella surugensis]|uniref:Uncharacterized protein n=1 Tax=Shewanella surugensis TaxID=212020 RepID=A0ABT0LK12_9GAMM|nr:hypothetical protein [Shewanella surugensis]MCL1128056.1 hypothetical protein [Shewanella surugensis]
MTRYIPLVVLFFSAFTIAEEEVVIGIDKYQGLKVHTSLHSMSKTRKIGLFKVDNVRPACSKGFFFEVENDKETYSALLTAFTAGKKVSIAYLPGPTPWGDTTYCSISSVEILN